MVVRIESAKKAVLLSALFLLAASLEAFAFTQRSCHGRYVYTHYECTGPNQFITLDAKKSEINIKSAGDPIYLELLHSLSWRVMYCEENRGKIVLVGTYKPATKEFLMERWYWQGNVRVICGPEIMPEPEQISIKTKNILSNSDFDCDQAFDLRKLGIVEYTMRQKGN